MKNQILIFLLILFPLTSLAQWERTDGIYGGDIEAINISGNNFVIGTGTGNGVYYSTNNCESWLKSDFEQWTPSISSNTSGTFAVGYMKIYRSTNSGVNWTMLNIDNHGYNFVYATNDAVYAGTSGYGLYRSTNNGENWSHIELNSFYSCMVSNGQYLFAGEEDNGVYISNNGGLNWTPTSLTGEFIRCLASNGNNIVAGTGGTPSHGVFYSSNNGINWVQTSLNNKGIKDIYYYGNSIYAVTFSDGIYISTNNGLNWTQRTINYVNYRKIIVTNGKIFAGTSCGLFISTNEGINWEQKGLNIRTVIALASTSNKLFAGTESIYFSSNNGSNWNRSNMNYGVWSLVSRGNEIFVGNPGSILYSSDEGVNWINRSPTNYEQAFSLALSGNMIYAGTYSNPSSVGGVLQSSNNGIDWIRTGVTNKTVNSLYANENIVYAGTNNGMYLTTNSGANWILSGLPNETIYSIAAIEDTIYAGTYYNGIYKNINGINSWVNTGLNSKIVYALISTGSNIVAGTDSGIYVSRNSGINWFEKNQGFEGKPVCRSLLISNGYIFGGFNNLSVWKCLTSVLLDINRIGSVVPKDYFLHQNYPNPFNPSTTIRFDLPQRGNTIITVVNILGQKVAILVNQNLDAGSYNINWNASSYSSGIYFYQLSVDGKVNTFKKMIVVK